MKCKVVISDYGFKSVDSEERIITEAGGILVPHKCRADEEVIEAAKDADILMVQYYEINERIINALEKCKFIIRYGIGINNIDINAASKKGIYVANVPDYAIEEVSDHAAALALALIRKVKLISKTIENGDWDYNHAKPIRRIKGQTFGLIGYGRIARLLSKKIKGFGFNVLAFDPYITQESINGDDVTLADFDTIIQNSDIISLHAPLTMGNMHLFNKDVFSRMKNSACLINTSRGALINECDLIEAIESGEIAGAAIDVAETEPLSEESKLRHFDNVIVTPHMAWYSEESQDALQVIAAQYAAAFMRGELPLSVINKELKQE